MREARRDYLRDFAVAILHQAEDAVAGQRIVAPRRHVPALHPPGTRIKPHQAAVAAHPDQTLAVDQDQGRRALHAIGRHGSRNRATVPGEIDPDGEGQTIFVDERRERHRCHRVVMFEDGVKADDRHL